MAEFGTLDLEEVAGEDARLTTGGQANFLDQFVSMPEVKVGQTGIVNLRILPPMKGGKLFQYNRTHKLNDRSIHCPRPLINGKWDKTVPCPICDRYSGYWKQIDKLKAAGHTKEAEKLKAEADVYKANERYYYNAIVRTMLVDGKEMKNVGPRIFSVGKKLHAMIIRAIIGDKGDPASKLGNITDMTNGWDLIVRKTITPGDGFPNYDTSGFARVQTPAGTPEEIARWQESLHDLTKLRNPKDVEYLQKELAIHLGYIPDDAETMDIASDEVLKAKFKNPDAEELVNYKQVHNVPEAVVADKKVETPAAAPVADVAIEDEAFIAELEAMGQ